MHVSKYVLFKMSLLYTGLKCVRRKNVGVPPNESLILVLIVNSFT